MLECAGCSPVLNFELACLATLLMGMATLIVRHVVVRELGQAPAAEVGENEECCPR